MGEGEGGGDARLFCSPRCDAISPLDPAAIRIPVLPPKHAPPLPMITATCSTPHARCSSDAASRSSRRASWSDLLLPPPLRGGQSPRRLSVAASAPAVDCKLLRASFLCAACACVLPVPVCGSSPPRLRCSRNKGVKAGGSSSCCSGGRSNASRGKAVTLPAATAAAADETARAVYNCRSRSIQ